MASRIGKILKDKNNFENLIFVLSHAPNYLKKSDLIERFKTFESQLNEEIQYAFELSDKEDKIACHLTVSSILSTGKMMIYNVLGKDSRDELLKEIQIITEKKKVYKEFNFMYYDEQTFNRFNKIIKYIVLEYNQLKGKLNNVVQILNQLKNDYCCCIKETEELNKELCLLMEENKYSFYEEMKVCIKVGNQQISSLEKKIQNNSKLVEQYENDQSDYLMKEIDLSVEQNFPRFITSEPKKPITTRSSSFFNLFRSPTKEELLEESKAKKEMEVYEDSLNKYNSYVKDYRYYKEYQISTNGFFLKKKILLLI